MGPCRFLTILIIRPNVSVVCSLCSFRRRILAHHQEGTQSELSRPAQPLFLTSVMSSRSPFDRHRSNHPANSLRTGARRLFVIPDEHVIDDRMTLCIEFIRSPEQHTGMSLRQLGKVRLFCFFTEDLPQPAFSDPYGVRGNCPGLLQAAQ